MKTLTRTEAIDRLRSHLLGLMDDEHTICDVAAARGIFCLGYRRMSDQEPR